jgi:hypothetical protein
MNPEAFEMAFLIGDHAHCLRRDWGDLASQRSSRPTGAAPALHGVGCFARF